MEPEKTFEAKQPTNPSPATPLIARQSHERAMPRTAISEGERVVFVEEGAPGQHVKLVVSGELDEFTLEALTNYIERQKRRLGLPAAPLN